MKNVVLSILITVCIVALFYFINLNFTNSYKAELEKQNQTHKSQQIKIESLENSLANALKENTNLKSQLDQTVSTAQSDAEIWRLHEEIRNLKIENKNLKDEVKSMKFDERKFQNKNLKIEIN